MGTEVRVVRLAAGAHQACVSSLTELVTNQDEGLNVSSRAHLRGKAWYVTITPALGIPRSHHSLAESGKLRSERDCLSRDRSVEYRTWPPSPPPHVRACTQIWVWDAASPR